MDNSVPVIDGATRAVVPQRQRILVVDDHEIVREGLRGVFERDPRYEIVGMASTGAAAMAEATRLRPDIVLLDLRLPDMPGEDVCRAVRTTCPRSTVIVLTTYLTEDYVRAALLAGAHGYVTKGAGLREIRRVLRVVTGQDGAPRDRCQWQVQAQLQSLMEERAERTNDSATTPQQQRVLELLSQGLTNKVMAGRLYVSESTVRFHVHNLKEKLGARTRTELVLKAVRDGLIATPDGSIGDV